MSSDEWRPSMRAGLRTVVSVLLAASAATAGFAIHEPRDGQRANRGADEGLGRAHMDISCSPAVTAEFDHALALLHNFWYVRAFERFNQIAKTDPGCAMAYWGAAMTLNHPFWDPPSPADEHAAWSLVKRGLVAPKSSDREKLYLDAVATLYKRAVPGPSQSAISGTVTRWQQSAQNIRMTKRNCS